MQNATDGVGLASQELVARDPDPPRTDHADRAATPGRTAGEGETPPRTGDPEGGAAMGLREWISGAWRRRQSMPPPLGGRPHARPPGGEAARATRSVPSVYPCGRADLVSPSPRCRRPGDPSPGRRQAMACTYSIAICRLPQTVSSQRDIPIARKCRRQLRVGEGTMRVVSAARSCRSSKGRR
jgi:hypothetical protein